MPGHPPVHAHACQAQQAPASSCCTDSCQCRLSCYSSAATAQALGTCKHRHVCSTQNSRQTEQQVTHHTASQHKRKSVHDALDNCSTLQECDAHCSILHHQAPNRTCCVMHTTHTTRCICRLPLARITKLRQPRSSPGQHAACSFHTATAKCLASSSQCLQLAQLAASQPRLSTLKRPRQKPTAGRHCLHLRWRRKHLQRWRGQGFIP